MGITVALSLIRQSGSCEVNVREAQALADVRGNMFLIRALSVWLIIIFCESVHGTLRQVLLAPRVGDFRARQISFFTGMLLIFGITCLFIRWIRAESTQRLLIVGLLWLTLTVLFEFGLGLLILGYSWNRMFEDYDLSRGGLMGFGLLFMLFAPLMAARLRNRTLHSVDSLNSTAQR